MLSLGAWRGAGGSQVGMWGQRRRSGSIKRLRPQANNPPQLRRDVNARRGCIFCISALELHPSLVRISLSTYPIISVSVSLCLYLYKALIPK